MPSAHTAVKHELLVRLLDAWTPAALHGHKRVTYVEDPSDESAVAAARVFGEFADKLRGRALTMVLAPADQDAVTAVFAEYGDPPGLLGASVHRRRGGRAARGPRARRPDLRLVRRARRGRNTVHRGRRQGQRDPARRGRRRCGRCRCGRPGCPVRPGSTWSTRPAAAQSLVFATASEKALEKFKDELWALDEYAGVRLRDPGDAEGTLLDIRVRAEPGAAAAGAGRAPGEAAGRPPWPSFACGQCARRSSDRPTRPGPSRRSSRPAASPAPRPAAGCRWTVCRVPRR